MVVSPICDMLGIQYPVFQGGMAWIADGKLAAAVSNAGGLGIISAMNAGADYVREQIQIARSLTDKPFGVNIMLMSPHAEACAKVCAEEKPAVVTTGAGSSAPYLPMWKEAGIKVIPVIASVTMAKQAEKMGADAIVNANYQTQLLEKIKPYLTEKELDLARRARNCPIPVARRNNQAEYRQSTAFEALIGYWYLHDKERYSDMIEKIRVEYFS